MAASEGSSANAPSASPQLANTKQCDEAAAISPSLALVISALTLTGCDLARRGGICKLIRDMVRKWWGVRYEEPLRAGHEDEATGT